MSYTRIITLDGVHNFRDFGGWPTSEGRVVSRRRLYRSGHLARTTPEDRTQIDKLGIKTLADLRQPSERMREPNFLSQDAPENLFETAHGGHQEAPHLQFLKEGNLTVSSVQNYMLGAYKRIPTEKHHQHIFSNVFKQLTNGEPLLIHCAAGKDRTGILAALILSALGVNRDQVFEDYLLTNIAVDIDKLLPSIAARISKQTGDSIEPEALRPMLGVEESFLDAALSTIGPLDVYFENVLGLSKTDIGALRNALVQ